MGTPTKKATIWVIDLMPHSSSGPKHTMSTLKCLCGRASMDEKCKKTSPPLSVFLSTPSSSALLSTAAAAMARLSSYLLTYPQQWCPSLRPLVRATTTRPLTSTPRMPPPCVSTSTSISHPPLPLLGRCVHHK